jgi:hypothetical protein
LTKRNNIRNNMQRIGQLTGMSKNETIAAIRTRRHMLITLAIMAIGVITFQFYNGTMPLKYTGLSINDFSWFWGMM